MPGLGIPAEPLFRSFTGDVRMLDDRLREPLAWKKPRRVFVCSMSDLFHERVPFHFIDQVFAVMALCPQHTFQVLTKRPERMAEYFGPVHTMSLCRAGRVGLQMKEVGRELPLSRFAAVERRDGFPVWPLRNVWLGTSCEDQQRADERIPHLLRCRAAVRFLSCEPLLGPVQLGVDREFFDYGVGRNEQNEPRVHWVIVGGESGPKARPCDVEWIRSIVRQCRESEVPCFVKQLGSRPEVRHPTDPRELPFYRDGGFLSPWVPEWAAAWIRTFDRKGGDPDEWPAELRVREWPAPCAIGGAS